MSKVLGIIGTVASVASMVLPPPYNVAAQVVAVAATVGSAVLAKPPPAKGSVNQVQIGANMPTPYAIGRTYIGGNLVHDVGYGGDTNPYKSMVFAWSSGGPIHSIESFHGDFSPLTFSGGNAVGYYNNFLYLTTSLGTAPQPAALAGPFGAIPGWGATAKISGKTHGLVTLKFDKKGKRFASGIPQFGVVLKAELAYDPRLDSTYSGGSGSHRFDDETTWEWTENPALHAIAYARGRYQNGKKVFGCGFSREAIDLPAFVAHANVCDANGWKVGGVIYEPGSRKDNLKYILEAGAGEPVFGAKLSVRYSAPRVALDTITAADLADGDYIVPAMRSWRERLNGIIPKYRSEEHKWEYVQSDAISVPSYVEEDGEEKQEERQFSLVQDKDQAAQLASYALVNGREFGPIVLSLKPRLAAYIPGETLEIDIPELGLNGQLCEITERNIDPGSAIVTLTLVSETDEKHAFALGQSGTAPPTPTIIAPDVIDELVASNSYRSTPHVVASEAEMIALDVAEGEVAIRTDIPTTFIHNGGTTGTVADWTEAPSPSAPVSSVNGEIGDVALVAGDIPFTPAGAVAGTTVQTAIAELDSEKEPSIAAGTPAQYWRGDKSWQTLNGLAVANTPAGNIASTTVQAALNELDSEKLAAASYTAADVLSKLLTVDGAGSGIDADFLDGQSGSFYAPITSPGFLGLPTAPTTASSDNSTKVATTAFVQNVITDLIALAPGTLNTLGELATALGDDPAFATTVTTNLAGKLAKSSNLSDLTNVATARSNLGLVIGTDVQAQDAQLAAISGLTPANDQLTYWTGAATAAMASFTASGRAIVALNVVQGDLLYADGTGTVTKLAKSGSATRYLSNTGTSNNPAWVQVDLSNGVTGDLPFANLTQGSALSVLGVTGNATADVASIAAGLDHQVLRRSGTAVSFGAVNLASANAVTGVLPVANGGVDQAAWSAWTPTITSGTGTITTFGTVLARYKQIGKIVFFQVYFEITTNGTGGSYINITLPTGPGAMAAWWAPIAGINYSTNVGLTGRGAATATEIFVLKHDGTYPGASGQAYIVHGSYEV